VRPDDGDRHQPERERALLHAVVEQHLEQRRARRLGRRGDDRADEGEDEAAPAVGEEGRDPAQALAEAALADGGRARASSSGGARAVGASGFGHGRCRGRRARRHVSPRQREAGASTFEGRVTQGTPAAAADSA
jgi:hypothetical protein